MTFEQRQRSAPVGRLMMIGGAEDRQGKRQLLREFVRLAGAEEARIVIIAVASQAPCEVASVYQKAFRSLGASEACALDVRVREDAGRAEALQAIEQATGVFFTGGNQLRLTEMLRGTRLDAALHERHEAGMLLAGTSAGAAMMSSIMIVGNAPGMTLRAGMVKLAPGMGFLSGVLIDQHFEQRGRLRRLLSAVVQHRGDLGLGIDENTAAIVDGHLLEVFGENSITIIDAGDLAFTNLEEVEQSELLAVCGVKIHILPAGYRFDLQKRTPVVR